MALETKHIIEQSLGIEPICPESFDWFSQLCPIRLLDKTDMDKLSTM